MKVENMTSSNGNKVANQFIIYGQDSDCDDVRILETFQSYESVIAQKCWYQSGHKVIELDRKYWNYSRTTAKYRNQFLGETTKETQKKIDSGEYILTDLN
jgi:hypothetical protein